LLKTHRVRPTVEDPNSVRSEDRDKEIRPTACNEPSAISSDESLKALYFPL